MRVLPRENEAVNECWITDKERFSYEALSSAERLQKPMIRVDGSLREVEWNVALDYVAHALKDIVARHGAEQVATLASPHATLEELYLAQKLTRGLGSGNVDFRPRRRDFAIDAQRTGVPWLGLRLSDILELDAALVVGGFLRKDHPLFAQRLRQLTKKYGGEVSLIAVTDDDPLIKLHERMTASPDALPHALAAVLKAAAELKKTAVPAGLENVTTCARSRAIAESLLAGSKRAIFLGNIAEQNPHANTIHRLALELAKLTGAKVGFIGEAANSVGGYAAQATPDGLNAYEMFAQPRQAYLLHGIEPELDCHNPQQALAALKQAALVVMLTPFKHPAALDYADVLLPCAPFTETSGTFVNCEGRAQSFNGVVPPLGETRPAWKVLRVLGNLLELEGFAYETSEQIRAEVLGAEEFVGGLDNALTAAPLVLPAAMTGLQRISDVPIYFADPLARRAEALQRTQDAAAPTARMNATTLAALGLKDGDAVRVRQGEGVAALTAQQDERVPENCVRVAAAHAATAMLGDMFATINVERA